jgi:phosphate transport system permease protein
LHVYEPKEIVDELEHINRNMIMARADRRNLGSQDFEGRSALDETLAGLQEQYAVLDEKRKAERFMYPDGKYRILESMQDQLSKREMLRIQIKNLEGNAVENAAMIREKQQALGKVERSLVDLDAERLDLDIAVYIPDFKLSPQTEGLELIPPKSHYKYATYSYSGGGIGPPIVGTLLLVTGSVIIALTLGVLCAVYLSEYSKPGFALESIRLSVLNLSGVPSIVFGLFGYGMLVIYGPAFTTAPSPNNLFAIPLVLNGYYLSFEGWDKSLLAGCFTLAFMALPLIIAASEESLKAIPKGFREGSLALGATKWTTIRTNVLPYAMPGILTSSIMGIARVAGETAPIMFTAAFAMRNEWPWENLPGDSWLERVHEFFFQGVMALPYHIYVVSAKIPSNEYTRNMQYGATFVFMLIVGVLAITSIILRIRVRGKLKW